MENTVIDGRYTLLAPLGTGGEARVFRAHDAVTQSAVALRLGLRAGEFTVPPDAPPASPHPGWIRLLASGSDAQFGAFQVFELLEGSTLRQLVLSAPLPADALINFMTQSLAAVEALHDAGWIHGDLNAGNFFRTPTGWKLLELPFTRPAAPLGRSAVFGSIHTLAPEQIDGAPPTVASDLYSLGCLYYHAASGAWPHPGANTRDIAIHCVRFPPEPLSEKTPGLPALWCDAILQLISTRPAERPLSARAARRLLGIA